MTPIKHRPGDPRATPPLRDAWRDDRAPGSGLARAIAATVGVLAGLLWGWWG